MRLHPHALRILTAGVVLSAVLLTGCSGGGGGGGGARRAGLTQPGQRADIAQGCTVGHTDQRPQLCLLYTSPSPRD